MRYAQIIHKSWELTTQNPKLKWLVFIYSFSAVLVFVLEMVWQLYLYWGEFVSHHEFSIESIQKAFRFLVENNLLGWSIFFVIFILFFSFVLPSWIYAALILGVKQKLRHPDKYCSIREKMITASDYFFRLFEFHAIAGIFSPWSILLFVATFYRVFHDTFFKLLWPLFLGYAVISSIITVFISFVSFFIVCENEALGISIRKSIGLVFLNFGRTMSIILLMFLVNFRVVINVIVILAVPAGIFLAFSYFSNSFMLMLSVILGIFLLALTAYLTAILEVFSTAVWTESFLKMKAKQEALHALNKE